MPWINCTSASRSSQIESFPNEARTTPVGVPSSIRSVSSPHCLPLPKAATTACGLSPSSFWQPPGLQQQPVRSWIGGSCSEAKRCTSA
eukprot:497516-Pleurochrysis_carterae.AAC.1